METTSGWPRWQPQHDTQVQNGCHNMNRQLVHNFVIIEWLLYSNPRVVKSKHGHLLQLKNGYYGQSKMAAKQLSKWLRMYNDFHTTRPTWLLHAVQLSRWQLRNQTGVSHYRKPSWCRAWPILGQYDPESVSTWPSNGQTDAEFKF